MKLSISNMQSAYFILWGSEVVSICSNAVDHNDIIYCAVSKFKTIVWEGYIVCNVLQQASQKLSFYASWTGAIWKDSNYACIR